MSIQLPFGSARGAANPMALNGPDASDAVFAILCAFGAQQNARLTMRQLRIHLIDAGFQPATTSHLIRRSSLVRQSGKRFYAAPGTSPRSGRPLRDSSRT
jgi:hypothetical protein